MIFTNIAKYVYLNQDILIPINRLKLYLCEIEKIPCQRKKEKKNKFYFWCQNKRFKEPAGQREPFTNENERVPEVHLHEPQNRKSSCKSIP